MKLAEYLDACKAKVGVSTWYKLAQHIDIAENKLGEYYKGKHAPDDYTCFIIAECLEVDPAIVIADIRAETEKNEKRRDYFRSFHGALRKAGVTIMLALALSLSLLSAQNAGDTSKFSLAASAALMGSIALIRFRYFA